MADGNVQLEVEDHGRGVAGEVQDGRQGNPTLGVGIQGMRERMRQLSGRLDIVSRRGIGTKVLATAPVARHPHRDPPDTSQTPSCTIAELAARDADTRKRILIADDHELLRQGLRRVLQNEKEWVVCGEAENGKEALEKTIALVPDLVILDLSMPVMNGLSALRQIRQSRPQTKVLVLSVNSSPDVVNEVRAAGADGYLCKSNAAQDLLATLKSLFDRAPAQAIAARPQMAG
jgi:CheY-like chemotaxis protein